jgi:hypothetical protein
MHCDYQHCLPPAPAFCSCTARNAMRSVTTRPLLVCLMSPTPRTSLRMRYIASDALLRPRASHIRQVAGAAVPRRACCPRKSEGAVTIFSGVTPQCSLRAPARTTARMCDAATVRHHHRAQHLRHSFPIPYVASLTSRPPATTLFGAALSPPRRLPLARSPNCHLHHDLRAALALTFLHHRPALQRLMRCPSASSGPHRCRSTPARPIPRLRTLGA